MTFLCPACGGQGETRPHQELPVFFRCSLCLGIGRVSLWIRIRYFLFSL